MAIKNNKRYVWLDPQLYPDYQRERLCYAEFKKELYVIAPIEIEITANARYMLFVNNEYIGRGPTSVGGDFLDVKIRKGLPQRAHKAGLAHAWNALQEDVAARDHGGDGIPYHLVLTYEILSYFADDALTLVGKVSNFVFHRMYFSFNFDSSTAQDIRSWPPPRCREAGPPPPA